MSESGEVRNPPNGTQSTLRSESFRDTSRFILKFMSQMTFDKICMVLAEVIGTATLLFLGCAGGVHWNGPPAAVQGPLNFGLTVMMIIQIFGHISYAILNPAVAVCAVINNLISVRVRKKVSKFKKISFNSRRVSDGNRIQHRRAGWRRFGLRHAQVLHAGGNFLHPRAWNVRDGPTSRRVHHQRLPL